MSGADAISGTQTLEERVTRSRDACAFAARIEDDLAVARLARLSATGERAPEYELEAARAAVPERRRGLPGGDRHPPGVVGVSSARRPADHDRGGHRDVV